MHTKDQGSTARLCPCRYVQIIDFAPSYRGLAIHFPWESNKFLKFREKASRRSPMAFRPDD